MTALVAMAGGCTPSQADPPQLVIGMLAATTGLEAQAGDDTVRGATLAVEVVNDHGLLPGSLVAGLGLPGLGGAKLSLISQDTQGNAEEAVRQASQLVTRDHVVGIVLADSPQVAAGMSTEMQRLRVPLIDATNSADYLTELGMDWYFRVGPGDRVLAEIAFAFLRRHSLGPTSTVAVLTESGGDSATAANMIQEVADRTTSQIVLNQEVPADRTALAGLTARLETSTAQAIVGWAHSAEGATKVIQAAQSLPIIGMGRGFQTMIQPPAAGPPILRAVSWSAGLAAQNPVARAVAELYLQRFGRGMTGPAAAGFTAAMALAAAIDAGGSREPTAIRAALRQNVMPPTQLIMPWNGVKFAEDGRNIFAAGVAEQWAGADFRVVYPAELAAGPMPWPTAKAGA